MQKSLARKGVVIGIIILFVGAGVIPSINGDNITTTTSRTIINEGSLSGYVNDTIMNPLEGALVRVYFHETYEEDYSDSSGYYHVTNIPICYCLKNATASKEGYETEWILLSIDENTTYDFVLTPSAGNTLYVGGSGPGNYSSIQDAINDASDGDTVFVFDDSSPYYENVLVDKSINLIGEGMVTTIIDAGGVGTVVNVTAEKVNISGFTIQNNGSNGYPVQGCGMKVHSNNNMIRDNIVKNNKIGIWLESVNNNLISNNMVEFNTVYGIYLHHTSNNNFIKNNTISNSGHCGIFLHYSINNKLIGNNICYGGYNGVTIFFSDENHIINNSIIFNSYNGVELFDDSNENHILNNVISNNDEDGIWIEASSNNYIIENIITLNNRSGLWFEDHCSNNIISNNIIKSNNNYGGLKADNNFSNNTIKNNLIADNNGYGIYIMEGAHHPSNNNMIYHNNFINNTQNAYDECDNTWDSGYWSGGNYWSDYTGDDFYHGPGQNKLGRDWRGDTPYNIAGGSNQDRYPLILPYESERPFAIIEHPLDGLITSEHNVTIIGYITDNVGLVKSGTIYGSEWEGVTFWTESLPPYELTPKLDFDFIVELKPGWNKIGIHATDPSDNYGEDIVLVYYYPDIVYVDDDYNSSTQGWQQYCFNSIQDGVDVVAESGTVYVYNGTYYENVVVHKPINLIGENNENTIIDGGRNGDVVYVTADGVNISDFCIFNSSMGFSSDEGSGIKISESSNISILNCNLYNNIYGIQIRGSFNIVYNCKIFSNLGTGIRLTGNSNSLELCNISYNEVHGISIDGFSDSYISNCKIISNDYYGIHLDGTKNSQIFFSEMSSNKYGIYIYPSSNNTISNCDINHNERGIRINGLTSKSDNNTIKFNKITNNDWGIHISSSSNNNLIFHNKFINNTNQSFDECNNIWDDGYPSGGNYWSDFDEPSEGAYDNNSDGIGDIPYDISGGNNQDRYPLMEPYGMTKLTFSMRPGLFKFPGIIKNVGNKTAFNVQWKITIDGGIILVGREVSGYLPRPLLAGEEMSASPGIIFGLGRIVITIDVWADNAPLVSESIPGFLFLIFIKIREGYRLTPMISTGVFV